MSGQTPPRRRRIAGERRPQTDPDRNGPVVPASRGAVDTETRAVEPDAVGRRSVPLDKGAPPRDTDTDTDTSAARPASASPSASPTGRTSRGPAWWGARLSLVVLGAVLAVLVAALVLVLLGRGIARPLGVTGLAELHEAELSREAADTAPSVAEKAAETILAYDYRSLIADKDAARRFMTPEFAKTYTDTFERTVEDAARSQQAKVTSQVRGTSVVRATPDKVRVLLFVDQTTVASNREEPRVALNRVEMSMVKRGSTWLVGDITSY